MTVKKVQLIQANLKVADQDSSINTSDDEAINVGSLTLSAEVSLKLTSNFLSLR